MSRPQHCNWPPLPPESEEQMSQPYAPLPEWSKMDNLDCIMYVQAMLLKECADATVALRAAWQPIETAPKSTATPVPDGAYVSGVYLLGFCPDPETCNLDSAICVIWWEPLMKGGNGMWYGEGGYEMHPTHWMPLPAAPIGDKQ